MAEAVLEQALRVAGPIVIASIPVLAGVLIWRHQRRWEMRRDACLKALDVIDAAASNMSWNDIPPEGQPHSQPSSISKARRAYAELCVSCRAATVDTFLQVLQTTVYGAAQSQDGSRERKPTGQAIHDFRVQVRSELRFGGKELARMKEEAAILSQLPGTDDEA